MKKNIRHRSPINAIDSALEKLPPLVQRILINRDIVSAGQIDYQLKALQSPENFGGLEDAVTLLKEALFAQQRVCILGDFDADGATSTALAVRCLRAFGFSKIDYLVPNRFEFGYGLTPEIVVEIAKLSPDLLITVDNGIASLDGVAAAQAHGIKVLITDHHLPGAVLPRLRLL